MSAETVSLGVLSLSSATATVGIVPMAIVILFMSLATVFSGIALWQVKTRHPTVRSYGDIGQLMLGKTGRWFAEIQVFLLLIFIMAGHVNIFSTMANQIALAAGHSWQCTVAFKIMATLLSMFLNFFRKFKSNTWTAMVSCGSITAAAFTTIVGVIVMNHGEPHSSARIFVPFTETSIAAIFQGVSMVSVSYTGHMAYLPLMHEMVNIGDFPKALAAAQIFTTTMYSTVALVVYRYAGSHVPSPALSAAGPTVVTISYGLAAPTIVIAGVITGVVAAKMVNMWNPFRFEHAGDELRPATKKEIWAWRGIVVLLWVGAFLIANVVPQFGALLGLIGASVGSSICLGMPAAMKLWHDANQDEHSLPLDEKVTGRSRLVRYVAAARDSPWTTSFCYVLILVTIALTGLGLYGSIVGLMQTDWNNALFSCKSNL